MFCPQCGMEIEGNNPGFCPYCGRDLSPSTTSLRERAPERESHHTPSEGGRKLLIGLVIVIVVIIVACAAIYLSSDRAGNGDSPDIVITVTPGSASGPGEYIELSGDFADGNLTAYLDDSGQMVISLSRAAASGFNGFEWIMRDLATGEYHSISKDTADMVWIDPDVGSYVVSVSCTRADSEASAYYSGTIRYIGDRIASYTWVYDGRTFTASVAVSASEYIRYSEMTSPIRNGGDPGKITSMTITDGSAASLESSLRRAYSSAYGSSLGYGYADFLLSFVRSCIVMVPDSVGYGYAEYWAYPAETLYRGSGDTDDLAILYASLCGAAGYTAGYVLMPDEVLAAVSTGQSVPSVDVTGGHVQTVSNGGRSYSLASMADGLPLGYIQDIYTYDQRSGDFSVGGTKCPDWCGLYV